MAAASHKFQPPKGTRDFYPEDMAVRRHLESIWRDVSINHGFDEIEGPTFEHLELYTVKSGQEIVSELFSFRRSGGDTDYALRPEFTPTLARMVAARAAQLPKPIKWFCIENNFRAERPQRGRLREFIQWNVDVIGDPSPRADAEVIAVAIGVMERLGFTPGQIDIKISNRDVVVALLRSLGVAPEQVMDALALLDRRSKVLDEEYKAGAAQLGFAADTFEEIVRVLNEGFEEGEPTAVVRERISKRLVDRCPAAATIDADAMPLDALGELWSELDSINARPWCSIDFSIVRGLAYYTGTVFEIHEATGKERAIAGGGRYDNLVELFGGPSTPAVGFAMGDVVIRLVLEDLGLLDEADSHMPRPDAFIISAGKPEAEQLMPTLVANLRREGLHVRHSYRATRNVGKLLGDASKARARCAVILGDELAEKKVVIKDLESGDQRDVALEDLAHALTTQQ